MPEASLSERLKAVCGVRRKSPDLGIGTVGFAPQLRTSCVTVGKPASRPPPAEFLLSPSSPVYEISPGHFTFSKTPPTRISEFWYRGVS